MPTLVPCPKDLLKPMAELSGQSSDEIAGSWVVTQDPVLISDAGAQAIQVNVDATSEQIITLLNNRFGVAPGCSRVNYHNGYSNKPGSYLNDSQIKERVMLHELISTKLMRRDTVIDARMYDKVHFVSNGDNTRSAYFSRFDVLSTLRVTDPSISELKLLMMASKNPKGIIINSEILKSLAATDVKYKRNNNNNTRVHVVDKNFLIEDASDYNEYRLVYNPKRVKRLITLRSKKSTATDKDRPWQKHTCYNVLWSLCRSYHHTVQSIPSIPWLYGYGRFSTQGIVACMRILPRCADLVAKLRLTGVVRKQIRADLRLLTYHKATLIDRGECSSYISEDDYASFMKWYKTETKIAGIPKDAEARFKQLSGNLQKARVKRSISKAVDHKGIDIKGVKL